MKANRLKEIVGLLAPSLGESQVMPALAFLCFDEQGVFAYNDVVATRYTWDHELGSFGVSGKELSSLLTGWGERDLELQLIKENSVPRLAIKYGKGLTKLPAIPTSSFVYEDPKIMGAVTCKITEPERLSDTLSCVAASAANPIFKSVTLTAKEGENVIRASSCNGPQIMIAGVAALNFGKNKRNRSWIVPQLAVRQILAIAKLDPKTEVKLSLGRSYLVAKCGSGTVISKLLDMEAPDFEKSMRGEKQATVEKWKSNGALESALHTASIIFNAGEASCAFSLEDGHLHIKARNRYGSEHREKVRLRGVDESKLLEFHCNPNNLLQAYSYDSLDGSDLVLQENSALFGNAKGFLYGTTFQQIEDGAKKKVVAEEEAE